MYCPELIQLSVIEVSEDGKRVRCMTCGPLRLGQDASWIKKDSLSYHLKSDLHSRSMIAQQDRQSRQFAGEQSMREESAMEESLDFVVLNSTPTITPATTPTTRVSDKSAEEQAMWHNYGFSEEIFDAGVNCTAAEMEERKRLEREANDFDIWHAADFLPEEDPHDAELLLDELEQDDILTELLRNASMYISRSSLHFHIINQFLCRPKRTRCNGYTPV